MAPTLDFGLVSWPLLNLLALFPKISTFPSKNESSVGFIPILKLESPFWTNIRNIEIDELFSLLSIISPLCLSFSHPDSRIWSLSTSVSFTVSSFFRWSLSFFPSPSFPFPYKRIWFPLVPSKIKVFFGKSHGGESLLKTNFKLLTRSPRFAPHLPSLFSNSDPMIPPYSFIALLLGHFGKSCSAWLMLIRLLPLYGEPHLIGGFEGLQERFGG